jgi:hypothetical protein
VRALWAGIHRPDDLQPKELARLILDLLGDFLTDLYKTGFLLLGQVNHLAPHRQILWLGAASATLLPLASSSAGGLGGRRRLHGREGLSRGRYSKQCPLVGIEPFVLRPVESTQQILQLVFQLCAARFRELQQRLEFTHAYL